MRDETLNLSHGHSPVFSPTPNRWGMDAPFCNGFERNASREACPDVRLISCKWRLGARAWSDCLVGPRRRCEAKNTLQKIFRYHIDNILHSLILIPTVGISYRPL